MTNNPPAAIHEEFEKAFNAADLEALGALYEPEAILASGSGGAAVGPVAIREAYRGFLELKPQIRVQTLEVLEAPGGIAMLHGKWEITERQPDGAEVRRQARNTEVVRRQADGRWLFVIDNPFTP
jgi:uncharacterized protein (TIGR02246 family)